MSTEDKCGESMERSFDADEQIEKLCGIILVYGDNLDFEKAKEYIEDHFSHNVVFTADKYHIRLIAQEVVAKYINECPNQIQMFAFAGDSRFYKYCNDFKLYFENHSNFQNNYPVQFEYVFEYIQETIDFHTIHEKFLIKLTNEIKEDAVKQATKDAVKEADEATNTAKIAVQKAQNAAKEAAAKAVECVGPEINKKIEDSIASQMNGITKHISETSVTILGIFAGIVLAIVAGLFYSSAVLESVNKADIFRLLAMASVVGFICFNLIALMFHYVDKIRTSGQKGLSFISFITIVVNFVLIILMSFSICHEVSSYEKPEDETQTQETEDQATEIQDGVELGVVDFRLRIWM